MCIRDRFYTLRRGPLPLTDSNFQAFAVPPVPATAAPTNSSIPVSKFELTSGGFLIEFPATIGKTYTIFYSDTSDLANALMAQPSIVAPATRVQWIDNGPPKTISRPSPTNTSSRFY